MDAARAALKEAAEQLSSAAGDAAGELKDVVSAGLRSLAAGWEEDKRTFEQERK